MAKKAPAKKAARKRAPAKAAALDLTVPDPKWHPTVVTWFEALGASGQSVFYEASDWAAARLLAETMSRDLNPVPIGMNEGGEVVTVDMPVKGASLAAYRQAMAALLVTEGDRRRVELELERPKPTRTTPDGAAANPVALLDEYRNRTG